MPIQDVSTPMLNVFGNGLSTGYQTAGNIQQINQANDLANQGSALNNDINSQKYNDEVLNQPLNAANRQLGIAKANDSVDLINQGIPQQQAKANLASTLASTDATTLSTQEKKKLAIGSMAEQMDNTLGEQVTIPLPQMQQYRSQWKQITGKDLPTDPAEARETIKTYGDWQRNDGKSLMEKAKMASAEKIAKTRADATVEARKIGADASIEVKRLATAAAGGIKGLGQYEAQLNQKEAQGDITPTEQGQLDGMRATRAAALRETTAGKLGAVGVQAPVDPVAAKADAFATGGPKAMIPGATPAPTQTLGKTIGKATAPEGTKKTIAGKNYIVNKGQWTEAQ